MKIVTKTGDSGTTSLYCGGRVAKDHARVEACGTIDELCSFLGMARSLIKNEKTKKLIVSIQKELFLVGAEVATRPDGASRLKKRIDKHFVCRLENEIDLLEKEKTMGRRSFFVSGENTISSILDVARTIARRAERRAVTLARKDMVKNPHIIIYLNRLSDLLFLLVRVHETRHRSARLKGRL